MKTSLFSVVAVGILIFLCGCSTAQERHAELCMRLEKAMAQELPEPDRTAFLADVHRNPDSIVKAALIGRYAIGVRPVLTLTRRSKTEFDAQLYMLTVLVEDGGDTAFVDAGIPVEFTLVLTPDGSFGWRDFRTLPDRGFHPALFPRGLKYSLQLLPYPWFSSQLVPWPGDYFVSTEINALRLDRYPSGDAAILVSAATKLYGNTMAVEQFARTAGVVTPTAPDRILILTRSEFIGSLTLVIAHGDSLFCRLERDRLEALPIEPEKPASEH